MKRILTLLLSTLIALLAVGPFFVPVPQLEGTVPPAALADADSRFIDVGGLQVHFKEAGNGKPAFVLLHGLGASVFSWREVIGEFAPRGRTIAYDRPAFGLTQRPVTWSGENPYADAAQVKLATGLLDVLQIPRAVFVAHSAGAQVAVNIVLQHPERVDALILVAPALHRDHSPLAWLQPLLRTPQFNRLGPLLVRSIRNYGDAGIRKAWRDPTKITPYIYTGYHTPLRADDWDVALWEFTRAPREPISGDQLRRLADIPTLLVTGDDDRIVPTQRTIELAALIPGSVLDVVPQCGHLPHEECPAAFMAAVNAFLDRASARPGDDE